VEQALRAAGIGLARTGSPYAVAPGRIAKTDGSAYSVFTPFARAWAQHGWRQPIPAPSKVPWISPLDAHELPDAPTPEGVALPPAGEEAALRRWRAYVDSTLDDYADVRNRPDLNLTSRMSVHLKWGEIHPRTMLADVAAATGGSGPKTYRNELAWREFYADVVWRHPQSTRDYLNPQLSGMAYELPGERFDAWREGRTGYPIVDAGMRQLQHEGWMHNRVRMIVASFLVKDLHIEWQHGARHFMHLLVDADLASNVHGWQWVAGSGTDAAPYFRVFNPVTQGLRFDPDGEYVRRHVSELRDLPGASAHEPWLTGPLPAGYPERIVDHATERREALARYEATR
jgi:deoxyribodipyrimidine photo-lyase